MALLLCLLQIQGESNPDELDLRSLEARMGGASIKGMGSMKPKTPAGSAAPPKTPMSSKSEGGGAFKTGGRTVRMQGPGAFAAERRVQGPAGLQGAGFRHMGSWFRVHDSGL